MNQMKSEVVIKVAKLESQKAKKALFKHSLKKVDSLVKGKTMKFDARKLSTEKEITITKPVAIDHVDSLILLPYFKSDDKLG